MSHTGHSAPGNTRGAVRSADRRDAQDASRGGGPMAGAMRRMGIYLGLVEDDEVRGYGRYDTRQSEHPEHDRRYGGRYPEDRYDAHYDDD
jgi:hypothetical protein